jgi:uncharacterized membrane protein YidH (DUF202 family)
MQAKKRVAEMTVLVYNRAALGLLALVTGLVAWLAGARSKASARKLRQLKALPGQATLEWVLIGGIMVVIIVGLLVTVFRPQLETIVTNILNLVQTNTSGS